jgi:NMD protein affecting ribosome stability and mRNA decay
MKVRLCDECGRIAHVVYAKGYYKDLCQECYDREREGKEFKEYMDSLVDEREEVFLQ